MIHRVSKHRVPFVPCHEYYKQGTPEWLAARRRVTASSAAGKAGISSKTYCHLENEASRKAWRLESTRPMQLGHENEDPVARRSLSVIAPLPGMLVPMEEPMEEVGLYTHPDNSEWLSASPDRIIRAHPYRGAPVLMEVKYSELTVYDRPSVEYLVQTQLQAYTTGAEFVFLCMGHLKHSSVVFLVEYCPELVDWLMPRMQEFADSVVEDRDCNILEIGQAVKEVWDGKPIPEWCHKEHPGCHKTPGFFPPQPRWQLVAWNMSYGECGYYNIGAGIGRFSPTSGAVSEECFANAVGLLWKRVGVKVSYSRFDKPDESDVRSIREQLELAHSIGALTETDVALSTVLVAGIKIVKNWANRKLYYRIEFEEANAEKILDGCGGSTEAVMEKAPFLYKIIEGFQPALLDRLTMKRHPEWFEEDGGEVLPPEGEPQPSPTKRLR